MYLLKTIAKSTINCDIGIWNLSSLDKNGYLLNMPVNARDMAGTSKDKAGTNRDKAGTNRDLSLFFHACPFFPAYPCLFLIVLVRPCRSLSALVGPCLSINVSTFAIPAFLPLQTISTVFISMNMGTLTLLAKPIIPMREMFLINFFRLI